MPIFSLENFKYGLDDRRNALAMASGALTKLENAHITTGGEIEKRKAFNKLTLPARCFGLEVTEHGLTTFGDGYTSTGTLWKSASGYLTAADGWNYENSTPLYFQRLVHPNQYYISGSATASLMSEVICSTTFSGKAWVTAKYGTTAVPGGSPGTFVYYDGAPLIQGIAGSVLAGAESSQALMMTYLTNDMASLGWVNGYSAKNPSTPWLEAESFLAAPLNNTYDPVVTFGSSYGAIRPVAYPPVTNVAFDGSYFSFKIAGAGSGTCKIKITITYNITGPAQVVIYDQQGLTATKTGAEWATFIADVINKTPINLIGLADGEDFFSAYAVNDSTGTDGKIQIKCPSVLVASTAPYYSVEGTSSFTLSNETIDPSTYGPNTTGKVTISPNPANITYNPDTFAENPIFGTPTWTIYSGGVKANVVQMGATPTFSWEFVNGYASIGLSTETPSTSQTAIFVTNVTKTTKQTARWKCTVTRTEDSYVAVDYVDLIIAPL